MNVVLILAAVIFSLSVFSGYRKGFLKTAVTMTAFFLAPAAASLIYPLAAAFVTEHTKLEQTIRNMAYNGFFGLPGLNEIVGGSLSGLDKLTGDVILPGSWEETLKKLLLDQAYNSQGLERLAEEYVKCYTGMMIRSVSYLISVAAVWLAVRLGVAVAEAIGYVPVLSTLNRLAGMLLGMVRGVALLWLAGLILAMCSGYEWTAPVLAMIKESGILLFLYRTNPFA